MSLENLKIFGSPIDEGAVKQITSVMQDERAVKGALMADHHLGYSMPIGGVVAYDGAISPTGVGFDIACGNMAVKTNLVIGDLVHGIRKDSVKSIMREIQKTIEFGIGRSNPTPIDHDLFDSPVWLWLDAVSPGLKAKAAAQLGTVGSGNHYVDLLVDSKGNVWVANHFGSRGLGHTIASGFFALDAGVGFTERVPEGEDAVVFNTDSEIGQHYIASMQLAGDYAYAGREYVIDQVLQILGAEAVETVHNHHNYAWLENGLWIVRKGATPLTTEPAFIGGSMGDSSVIVRGRADETVPSYHGEGVIDLGNIGSAPHGAGRVMSRTKAAGKFKKVYDEKLGKKIRVRDASTAAIDWDAVRADLTERGIVVLGAGADEAPGVYKNLSDVIGAHKNIEVLETLMPIGVVMAGPDTYDPFKD